MARNAEARAVSLVDLPLVMRLNERGTILDSEMGFTRDAQRPNSALLSLLPQHELYTFVARSDKQNVVGQFRLKSDDPNAKLIYLAPEMQADDDDTAWLHILDAMAKEAGKNQAHNLIAEVDEDNPLFETLRTSGFAVYARQEIWGRQPGEYPTSGRPVNLTTKTDADITGIHSLFANTVPSLIQQVAMPSDDTPGLIYRKKDRIEAHIGVAEGKQGIFLTPLIHPDVSREAPDIIDTAMQLHIKSDKLPVYVCVRRHQEWLNMSLMALGFELGAKQALMVRHIAAGVQKTPFRSIEETLNKVPAKPPTRPLHQTAIESSNSVKLREK